MIESIPLPVIDDPTDAPFWSAARRGELVAQCCTECGRWRFPPRPMCPECQSLQHAWRVLSGRGRIWSYTAPRPPLLPAFEALLPYSVAVVELEDVPSLRMVGALLHPETGEMAGLEAGLVTIGAPVCVVLKRYGEDVSLPCWQLLEH